MAQENNHVCGNDQMYELEQSAKDVGRDEGLTLKPCVVFMGMQK